jgi:maspardin
MVLACDKYPVQSFVDDAGCTWQYRDNGRAGARALVLLPGALGNGDTAWEIARAFDGTHRVVSITYPGGVAADALAAGLQALLDSRNIGPAAIWGSSYGAWWGQAFASRFPESVSALWLGNTFIDGSDVEHSALFDRQWLDAASDSEVLARWHAALAARPDDPLRGVQLHMLHHGLPIETLHGRLRQVSQASALAPATGIANTVISDCDDDGIITATTRSRVAARYPQARRVSLSQGGHYPHITNVDELLPHMRRWLDCK